MTDSERVIHTLDNVIAKARSERVAWREFTAAVTGIDVDALIQCAADQAIEIEALRAEISELESRIYGEI